MYTKGQRTNVQHELRLRGLTFRMDGKEIAWGCTWSCFFYSSLPTLVLLILRLPCLNEGCWKNKHPLLGAHHSRVHLPHGYRTYGPVKVNLGEVHARIKRGVAVLVCTAREKNGDTTAGPANPKRAVIMTYVFMKFCAVAKLVLWK